MKKGERKYNISYEEAKKIVMGAKVKNKEDYYKWYKSNNIDYMPYNPQQTYKKSGWTSWGDFLGTGSIRNDRKIFLSYNDGKEYVRKLNIISENNWEIYATSGKKPANIPRNPDVYYKNKGWINWMDWLGTDNVIGSKRKYIVNDDYFKTFSHNMAYILGFFYTDGYINEYYDFFSISQHEKDRYILEGMLKDMNSNNPLLKSSSSNILSFSIFSSEIVKDIKRLGGHQAKSFTIQFPKNIIPKEFMPSFILGCWDGDGCISKASYRKSYNASFVSVSENFIYGILETLRNEIYDFKGSISRYNRDNDRYIFMLHVGIYDTIRLRDYLYKNINKNSLYLKRKYDRFMSTGEIPPKFLSYKETQDIIQKEGIKSYFEYKKYIKENNIANMPYCPHYFYKNNGWVNWKAFTGFSFLEFELARKFIRSLNIKTHEDWRKYAASGKKPKNIPSSPETIYSEWSGMRDWLGPI
jgi:hypothetical protein